MAKQHTQGRLSAGGSDRCVLFARPGNTPIASADTPEDAAELVRRWNAWEEGGAMAGAIEALSAFIERAQGNGMGQWKEVKAARRALAALVEPEPNRPPKSPRYYLVDDSAEPGAGAGREPQ